MSLLSTFKPIRQRFQSETSQKVAVLILLILVCASLIYYSHLVSGSASVYTHFFYIPIVLAGFWWGKRGSWVAVLLAASLMLSHIFSNLEDLLLSDALRSVVFIAVGLSAGFLRERTLRSEQSLRKTQNYLHNLIECAGSPIIVWDREGKVTMCNTALQRLVGYQADDIVGKPLAALFDTALQKKWLLEIEQTLHGQRWEGLELPLRCKGSEERILLWNASNIYSADGKTQLATIAQGQDITLMKRVEKALHLQITGLEEQRQVTESKVEQRVRELQTHAQLLDAMLRTFDLDKWLEVGLKQLMELLEVERGAVSLVEGEHLVLRKQFGFSEAYLAWTNDLALTEIPSCEEIITGWHDIPDFFSRLEAALSKEGVKRWAAVPLKSSYGLLGMLIFASIKPRPFSRQQLDVLSRLTGNIALMLEKARLYRIAQERLARLTTLREIDLAISANLSMEGIIDVLLRKVSPHIWVDAVGVSLLDWQRKHTVLARLHLPGEMNIEGEAFGLSDSLLAQLGVEKKPVVIYDVKSDPRLQNHRDIIRKYNLSSYVGVPLVVQDKVIGILHLFTVEPRVFSQEDLDFFSTMAGQAAISVQNARLYREAKQRAAGMESLANVTFDLLQFNQEEELAKEALCTACEVIDADVGGMLWYDEDTGTLRPVAGVNVPEKVKEWAIKELSSLAPSTDLPLSVLFTREPVYIPDMKRESRWQPSLPGTRSAYIVPLAHRGRIFGAYAFLSTAVDGFSAEQRALADTFAHYVASALDNVRLFRETRRAYRELQTTQAQLVQAQKMEAIGRLAGGVAHDFNNLLTSIHGYAELVLRELAEDNLLRHDLELIRRNAVRATELTRQLLLFSRRQPMEMLPLDLNALIKNMAKMLDRLLGEDISLETTLADELWTVKADSGSIEQVVTNLVINARDAMPEGGQILIKTENVSVDEEYCSTHDGARTGRFVCLTVQDEGVGMDAQTLEHIFEPFFTTKEPGLGTGLGLSVVYGIVKQHSGWIDVESAPGQGAIFRVYLPAISTRPVEKREAMVSLELLRGKGERILLVEDEQSVQEFTTKVLSSYGYVVLGATSAEQAQDIFNEEEGNFDLIFCDVVLPDGKGPQVVDRLLKSKPGIAVVFTSGYTDDKSGWQDIRRSEHAYLQKPYSLSELLQVVKNTLEKKAWEKGH